MSEQIKQSNPFKFEGYCYIVNGIITSILGIILLFGVKEQVTSGGDASLWAIFLGGFILVSIGLFFIGYGFVRILRFFIGKDVPKILTNNDLKEMLQQNMNSTYYIPKGTQHFLESLFFRLSETPEWIRVIALIIFDRALFSLGLFIIFGFSIFSGYTGLTNITSTPVADWLCLLLAVYLFKVWVGASKQIMFLSKRIESDKIFLFSKIKRLVSYLVIAILAPVIMLQFSLPEIPFSVAPWVMFEGILILLIMMLILIVVITRIPKDETEASVTKEPINLQVSLHPKGLFHSLEDFMKSYGYIKYPMAVEPRLISEGSRDKGSFHGHVLYETTPFRIENDGTSRVKNRASFVTVLSHLFFIYGVYMIFISLNKGQISFNGIFNTDLVSGIIILVFSYILISSMKIFFGEFTYKSNLIFFEIDGTYTESVFRSGKAVHDSHESENKVVNSDMMVKVNLSQIHSATLGLAGERYVTDMRENASLNSEIQLHLTDFIERRRTISSFSNEADLLAASNITKMNAISQNIKSQMTSTDLLQDQKTNLLSNNSSENNEGSDGSESSTE